MGSGANTCQLVNIHKSISPLLLLFLSALLFLNPTKVISNFAYDQLNYWWKCSSIFWLFCATLSTEQSVLGKISNLTNSRIKTLIPANFPRRNCAKSGGREDLVRPPPRVAVWGQKTIRCSTLFTARTVHHHLLILGRYFGSFYRTSVRSLATCVTCSLELTHSC